MGVLKGSLINRVRQYRHTDRYDAVFLHKKCLSFLDGLCFRADRRKVIFNYDDAILFNDKGHETLTHQKRFKRSLRKAGTVLVGSAYLADLARPYHSNVVILPLGLQTTEYGCGVSKYQDGRIRLVWIGSASTVGYIRQLAPILQRLSGKYPNLIVRMISDAFIDVEGVPMEKIVWTPQMRFRGLTESDIGLAPLPDTPFTRGKCSFKVLEYSASGLPVVASPVGTNPDHVREGQTGFLVNSEQEWFEKLCLLIENEPLRTRMGSNGRTFAREFDTAVIGQKLCELMRGIAR